MASRSRDYSTETTTGRVRDNTIYVGIVTNTADAQKMGRISCWIPELGGSIDEPKSWVTCSYASPFAGATDPALINGNISTMAGSQQSYGMWFVPPDKNNEVLVCFANGDIAKAFWFACVWQQNMNHMIPGVAMDSTNDSTFTSQGILPPVVEYNKEAPNTLAPTGGGSPLRPPFTPLADGLVTEGLAKDYERGPASTSARRESPSKVFGFLTPRGNSVSVDDNPTNEFIRMRTRSGAQILIHETTGYVYINSKDGNSWVEISDSGVDIYSANSVSIRAQADLNVRADGNIIFDAGSAINLRAGTDITMQAGKTIQGGAGTSLTLAAQGGNLSLGASQNLYLKAGSNLSTQSGSQTTMLAGGNFIRSAPQIVDNGASAPAVPNVQPAGPQGHEAPDIEGGASATLNTITSRTPTHEPWIGHPKSNVPPVSSAPSLSTTAARAGVGSTPAQHGTTPSTTVQTGDGNKTVLLSNNGTTCALGVGTRTCSNSVFNSIKTAASGANVPFGNLMAIADVESEFDPNANAGAASSAKGLFQFTSGTWSGLVNSYGNKLNVTTNPSEIYNPSANAQIGAAFYNENAKLLQSRGIANPTCGQVYMCHMLGGSGGPAFIAAYQSNPNAPLSSVLSPQVIANNPLWFRGATTVGQAYEKIDGTMNAKASAYDAQAGLPAPCDRGSSTSAATSPTIAASATGSGTTGLAT